LQNTSDKILKVALDLMQSKGFVSMSFQDIASSVGIKKPSVIHHFASKLELGLEVIRLYREHCADKLKSITDDSCFMSATDLLEQYFNFYIDIAKTKDKICLCCVLAGEFIALPKPMQKEVKLFFDLHQNILEMILEKGSQENKFSKKINIKDKASNILSSLQGALMLKRVTNDISYLNNMINSIHEDLLDIKSNLGH
jgi:TetR/AcrR family transcriptional repressor of nem operon